MTTPIPDEVLRSIVDDVPDIRLRAVAFRADLARELLQAREAMRRCEPILNRVAMGDEDISENEAERCRQAVLFCLPEENPK